MTAIIIVFYTFFAFIGFWFMSDFYSISSGLTILTSIGLAIVAIWIIYFHSRVFKAPFYWNGTLLGYFLWILILMVLSAAFSYSDSISIIREGIFFFSIGLSFIVPIQHKDLKMFDRGLALIVLVGIVSAIYLYLEGYYNPCNMLNRMEISSSRAGISWKMMSLGTYLLLKYSKQRGTLFFVGLIAIFFYAFTGAIAAFRGIVIVTYFTILLSVIIILLSSREKRKRAILVFLSAFIAVFAYSSYFYSKNPHNFSLLSVRFVRLLDTSTGGITIDSVSRFREVQNALPYFLNPRIIIGYGPGAKWFDRFECFKQAYRSMIHINYFHYLFKIGVIGCLFLITLLYKRLKSTSNIPISYWAFFAIWMLNMAYYGHKIPSPISFIGFIILVNPILFSERGDALKEKLSRSSKKRFYPMVNRSNYYR